MQMSSIVGSLGITRFIFLLLFVCFLFFYHHLFINSNFHFQKIPPWSVQQTHLSLFFSVLPEIVWEIIFLGVIIYNLITSSCKMRNIKYTYSYVVLPLFLSFSPLSAFSSLPSHLFFFLSSPLSNGQEIGLSLFLAVSSDRAFLRDVDW